MDVPPYGDLDRPPTVKVAPPHSPSPPPTRRSGLTRLLITVIGSAIGTVGFLLARAVGQWAGM